jgi:tetratricopeptide (TPR) repeat protein
MRRIAVLPAIGVILVCLGSGHPSARAISVPAMLDRYASGDFEGVLAELNALRDFEGLWKAVQHDGAAWIDAGGPADRARRELAAATFALEAARIDEWHDWKWIVRQPVMKAESGARWRPPDVLTWRPAARLVAWGCDLFLRDATPRPIERWWQLAAVAVAERSEDYEFLTANHAGNAIANPQDQIGYLSRLRSRFPNERRFDLALGIAIEWRWWQDARDIFDKLKDDETVGAEATMRLGAMAMRRRQDGDALKQFDRADRMTRDPYVVFLSRYFTGQTLERQQHLQEAQAAYRGALAAVPHAESASVALSALLFGDGRRDEAGRLADEMIGAHPRPADPWREYAHADDRFWPRLIARLRAEIRP